MGAGLYPNRQQLGLRIGPYAALGKMVLLLLVNVEVSRPTHAGLHLPAARRPHTAAWYHLHLPAGRQTYSSARNEPNAGSRRLTGAPRGRRRRRDASLDGFAVRKEGPSTKARRRSACGPPSQIQEHSLWRASRRSRRTRPRRGSTPGCGAAGDLISQALVVTSLSTAYVRLGSPIAGSF